MILFSHFLTFCCQLTCCELSATRRCTKNQKTVFTAYFSRFFQIFCTRVQRFVALPPLGCAEKLHWGIKFFKLARECNALLHSPQWGCKMLLYTKHSSEWNGNSSIHFYFIEKYCHIEVPPTLGKYLAIALLTTAFLMIEVFAAYIGSCESMKGGNDHNKSCRRYWTINGPCHCRK